MASSSILNEQVLSILERVGQATCEDIRTQLNGRSAAQISDALIRLRKRGMVASESGPRLGTPSVYRLVVNPRRGERVLLSVDGGMHRIRNWPVPPIATELEQCIGRIGWTHETWFSVRFGVDQNLGMCVNSPRTGAPSENASAPVLHLEAAD